MNTISKGYELPKFDQVITIEVSVASIYDKLVSTFPEDYKHKEALAHAIIGTTKDNGSIAHIYNALNGYTNAIDFQIGDEIDCGVKSRRVVTSTPGETAPNISRKVESIGFCKIVDIDM